MNREVSEHSSDKNSPPIAGPRFVKPQILKFKVRKQRPELIPPAKPTPRESKPLSDVDSRDSLRVQMPLIHFYAPNPDVGYGDKDPVKVIRAALAETLVHYYPYAGRLREGPGRKPFVDCTAEGVMFMEADADVRVEDFGDIFHPPFPCCDELLFDVSGSGSIFGSPILLIQVTRLLCGGFIFAIRLNHVMGDAIGIARFMATIGEIALGADGPSVPPVWQRELLNARNPPRVTCRHPEFIDITDPCPASIIMDDTVHCSFLFGPKEISALCRLIPHHLNGYSTFELLVAFLWRSRTIALQLDSHQKIRVMFTVDARARFNPPLPAGYYGNGFGLAATLTTAQELCQNSLAFALDLVMKAKAAITKEYMKSLADLTVITGRAPKKAPYMVHHTYFVSDNRHVGFGNVNFGWGKSLYSGVAKAPEACQSFMVLFRNQKGENEIVVPICLSSSVMKRFHIELESMCKVDQLVPSETSYKVIKSPL